MTPPTNSASDSREAHAQASGSTGTSSGSIGSTPRSARSLATGVSVGSWGTRRPVTAAARMASRMRLRSWRTVRSPASPASSLEKASSIAATIRSCSAAGASSDRAVPNHRSRDRLKRGAGSRTLVSGCLRSSQGPEQIASRQTTTCWRMAHQAAPDRSSPPGPGSLDPQAHAPRRSTSPCRAVLRRTRRPLPQGRDQVPELGLSPGRIGSAHAGVRSRLILVGYCPATTCCNVLNSDAPPTPSAAPSRDELLGEFVEERGESAGEGRCWRGRSRRGRRRVRARSRRGRSSGWSRGGP